MNNTELLTLIQLFVSIAFGFATLTVAVVAIFIQIYLSK